MNVLIIDDTETVRITLKTLLADMNIDSTEAENGQTGLDRTKEDSFDLILLDLNMPVMDGLEFLEKLRADSNDTPVVVCSVYSELSTIQKAISLGANDYIIKPFDFTMVKSKIEHYQNSNT